VEATDAVSVGSGFASAFGIGDQSRNVAACPQRWPAASVRFQTVARSIMKRRPVRAMRTLEKSAV